MNQLLVLFDVPDLFQELVSGEKVLFPIAGPNALETHNPYLVDNKIGPLGTACFFIKYTKGLHDLLILKITENGVIQFQEIRKGFLRKGCVGTYA